MQVDEMNKSIYRLIKLPDLVTLINALLGFTAILMMVQSPSNACHASILIILAVIADGLDGAIARSMEYGVLGENLDSLADVISFGLAPAVIAYAILAPQYHNLVCVVGGAFLACGILRLARFNAISAKEGFVGLPITTSGLAVVLYLLVFYDMGWQFFSHGLLAIMSILAILMISRVYYPKIKNMKYLGLAAVLMIILVLLFYLGNTAGARMVAGTSLVVIVLYLLSPLFKMGR